MNQNEVCTAQQKNRPYLKVKNTSISKSQIYKIFNCKSECQYYCRLLRSILYWNRHSIPKIASKKRYYYNNLKTLEYLLKNEFLFKKQNETNYKINTLLIRENISNYIKRQLCESSINFEQLEEITSAYKTFLLGEDFFIEISTLNTAFALSFICNLVEPYSSNNSFAFSLLENYFIYFMRQDCEEHIDRTKIVFFVDKTIKDYSLKELILNQILEKIKKEMHTTNIFIEHFQTLYLLIMLAYIFPINIRYLKATNL